MNQAESQLTSGAILEGRYEIITKLGEGGFGTVFKARQLTTGQVVALKLMRVPDFGGDAQKKVRVARFLQEVRLCAQMHHPNIVQVVDAGQRADGVLYTVFAFAPGDTLAAVVAKEGGLAPAETKHLMLQVLDALTCAHAQGVVHRDLKPSNIMVVSTGARRNAVVLDFGIGAMLGGEPGSDGPRLTGVNETVGTPGYCAPEQLRGQESSARSDLFSWAVVLVECLSGRPIYAGTSAEVLYQMLADVPVPLPLALQGSPLFELLEKATRKDVAARDLTAQDALRALEACDLQGVSRADELGEDWSHEAAEEEDGGAPRASGPRTAPRVRGTGDRRHVTALCCRIEVAPPTNALVDIEEQDAGGRATLASCSEIARAHGGHLMSALGDTLLVYFGYPRAEEDDARRAGRAADAIARATGAQLPVAVGLHSGPVFPEDPQTSSRGLAMGATAATAVRLAVAAAPGTVLMSAASELLTRADLETECVVDDARLLTAFRLVRARPASVTGVQSAVARALVGRDQEMEVLVERWRRVLAGTGQCSLVTGEAGIGKSTLVRHFRTRLPDPDHLFLEGRCSPDAQHTALLPVVELLQRSLGLDQTSEPKAKVARLEQQLTQLAFALPSAMPLFLALFSLPFDGAYAPVEASPQRQRTLTLDILLSLIFAMAEQKPLVLLVEDLHWADTTTIELLTMLAREISTSRALLVMTARPEFEPTFSTTSMLQLHLGRLDSADVEAMVAELAAHKSLPPSVLRRVIERTDGVPLFVEELTSMMLDGSLLTEIGGRYELTGELSEAEIPATLRGLLAARFDRLERAKTTAQIAAALGREFGLALLSAASPLGRVAVNEDLETLTNAGLVLRKRRLKDPLGVFKHALVRDVVYESLARPAREEVHLRIARAVEEHFPELTKARPDLLAHHYAAADKREQAVRYSTLAAQQGLARSAYADAIAHASKVVDWAGALDGVDRIELQLSANEALSQALMATKGWADPTVKKTVDHSAALVRQLDAASPHRVSSLWSLFAYHHVASNRPSARAAAEELLSVADRSKDSGLQAAATVMLACTVHAEGKLAEASKLLERVIELYEPTLHRNHGSQFGLDSLVLAKTLLAHVRWFEGDDALAFQLVTEGLRWAREVGHLPSLALGLLYGSQVYQFAGDKAQAAAMTGEILGLSAKYGLPAYEGYAAIVHSWATSNDGQAEGILGVLSAMGCNLSWTYFGSLVGEIRAERGEFARAIECMDHCLALCDQYGEHYFEPELYRKRAVYQRQQDAGSTKVRGSLEAAARTARAHGLPRVEAFALHELREIGADQDGALSVRLSELSTQHAAIEKFLRKEETQQ